MRHGLWRCHPAMRRPGEAEMGQGADGFVEHDAAMVENFLKLRSSFAALMCGQVCLAAHIDRTQCKPEAAQLIGSGSLESLDGLRGVIAAERELSVNRRLITELHQGVFREALGQIIGQCLRPAYISGYG